MTDPLKLKSSVNGKDFKTNGELLWNLSEHDVFRFELGTRRIIDPPLESFRIGDKWRKIYLADTKKMKESHVSSSYSPRKMYEFIFGSNPQFRDLMKIELKIFD